jgi:hypothetical protein
MDLMHHARPATAALLAAAALATAAPLALATPSDRGGGGGGGGGGAPATTSRLPPSWPKDVPVPPGQIQGTNIAPGHAVVQLIVRGSAAGALRSTIAFYHARGWRGAGPGVHKGHHKLVVVTENRDHSATKTFVVISVTPYRP